MASLKLHFSRGKLFKLFKRKRISKIEIGWVSLDLAKCLMQAPTRSTSLVGFDFQPKIGQEKWMTVIYRTLHYIMCVDLYVTCEIPVIYGLMGSWRAMSKPMGTRKSNMARSTFDQ